MYFPWGACHPHHRLCDTFIHSWEDERKTFRLEEHSVLHIWVDVSLEEWNESRPSRVLTWEAILYKAEYCRQYRVHVVLLKRTEWSSCFFHVKCQSVHYSWTHSLRVCLSIAIWLTSTSVDTILFRCQNVKCVSEKSKLILLRFIRQKGEYCMWLLCLQPFVDLILASFTRSSPRKAFQSEIKHVCYAAKLLNSIRNLAKCASFRGQTFPCKKKSARNLGKVWVVS